MGVIVVEIFRGFLLALGSIFRSKLLIEEVGRDVVDIDKLDPCLLYYLAIPLAVGVVAALNFAARPFIAGGEGE